MNSEPTEIDEEEEMEVPEQICIDLHGVSSARQLHELLRKELQFPLWYGHNWDAFWDAIRGLVPLPKRITFIGWANLVEALPEDSRKLRELFDKYSEKYGCYASDYCEVIYL
ncbi:barstar family protein [Actinoplanes sp. NPDC051859]|uniref:barstar family protein n=1 Tax=Actinoplanes sp. NPDC051859 TaxID=3363909 RepID=UPI0037B84897